METDTVTSSGTMKIACSKDELTQKLGIVSRGVSVRTAVQITCGSAAYRLNTYAADDFPRLPELAASALHTVESEALLETIARVSRSASRDESRPVLTGILVRFEPG